MAAPETQPRLLRLRYEGACAVCRTAQPPGTEAWWYAHKKEIVCVSCQRAISDFVDEMKEAREALEIQGQADAPGEEALGARLTELAGERLVVLHDRRVPASRGNIDHLAVTPGGVFVIDVKHCGGKLEKRNLGNILRSDVRLYVGGRDRTKLLLAVENQAEIVRDAVRSAGFIDVPVRGVLCFIGAEWGPFPSPFKLGNVLVTYPQFLYRLLGKDAEVATTAIQDAAGALAIALPSA